MTRLQWGLMTFAALALTSCKEQHADEHATEPKAHAEEHAHEEGEADGDRVHVDPSMLRDLRVTTAPVEERAAGEGVTALGEVGVNEQLYVEVAAPMPAQVTRLFAAAGDTVKAGQPLAELYSADLGRAAAALAGAEARVAAAARNAERKSELATEGVVAPREAQEAAAALAATEAEAAAARSELGGAGLARSAGTARFVLKSAIGGTVLERNAVVGRAAEPSQPLFRVADLSTLWLTAHAFERDAVRLRTGAEGQVTLAALPGRTFPARVTFIGARVDPASRTIPVRLELTNADRVLKPGMSASAFIPLGDESSKVTTVPATALQRLDDGWYVFLPTAEAGAYERRIVGRGRTLGGEVEILSGLKADERVVVDGAFLLKAEFEKARGGGEEHAH